MIIYKITNTVTGKSYIGQTVQPLTIRWTQHKSKAKHGKTYLARAIRKNGSDAFQVETLFTCSKKDTLNLYEQGFIEFYSTTHKDKGYNLTTGGEGTCGRKCRLATRQRISKANKGKISPYKGVHKITHCKQGHRFTEENTYVCASGRWSCRECNKLKHRTYRGRA